MKQILMAILIALATALPNMSQAQTSFFAKEVDSLLLYVDKSPITSGYLYDRAMPYSRYNVFNNSTDTTNLQYALQTYLELFQAAYQPQRMTNPSLLNEIVAVQNYRNRIPIQVLDYNYQEINQNAIEDGLLVVNGNNLTNAPGNPNPFITKRLQLTTLMAENIKSPSVMLYLFPHLLSRNTGLDVKSVLIEGAGINTTLIGTLDSANVTFDKVGKNYLTITTTLTDGSSFSTINEVNIGEDIAQNNTSRTTAADVGCFRDTFQGNIPWQGYEEDSAFTGIFDLDVYYRLNDPTAGCNRASNTEYPMKKPVILIDGFDPTDKRTSENFGLYQKFLRYIDDVNYPASANIPIDFVEEVRKKGNDVILVDIPTYWVPNTGNIIHLDSNANNPPPGYTWDMGKLIRGGGDYVERNARTMVSLLLNIQSKIAPNDSIVLIDPSMGGQITRYALKYMEDRGIPHRVKLWVSMDSNHEGAVVPIGEQFAIAKLAQTQAAVRRSRDRQLLCPVAQQFLIDHFMHHVVDTLDLTVVNQNVGGSPKYFNRYYNTIDSIGWPSQCRKIAAISGGEDGSKINILNPSDLAMTIKTTLLKTKVTVSTLFGWPSFVIKLKCKDGDGCDVLRVKLYVAPGPSQNATVCHVFEKGTKIGSLQITPDKNTYFNITGSNHTGTQSLENVQSGFYHGYDELKKFVDLVPYFDTAVFGGLAIASLANSASFSFDFHSFQPTGSTLAYGRGQNPNVYGQQLKWDDDVTSLNLSCDRYIPFDYYMGPRTFSVLHDSIFYPQALVLIDEIQGIKHVNDKPTHTIFLRNMDDSKKYFCANETLYFKAESNLFGTNTNPIWAVDNNYFEIVSGQGTGIVGVKYLGGMSYEYMQNSTIPFITAGGEGNCYHYNPINQIGVGLGDVWSGTIDFMTGSGNANMPFVGSHYGVALNYLPSSNSSDRYRVRVKGGLTFKETNVQQFSLLQNTNNTAFVWGVYPYTDHNYTQNMLNIMSNLGGEYLYQITDANRCGAGQTNTFSINFSNRNLMWRIVQNPANNELIIEKEKGEEGFAKTKLIQFTIIDIHSKQILLTKKMPNASKFNIPISGLKNGEYAVLINADGQESTLKFWVRN